MINPKTIRQLSDDIEAIGLAGRNYDLLTAIGEDHMETDSRTTARRLEYLAEALVACQRYSEFLRDCRSYPEHAGEHTEKEV